MNSDPVCLLASMAALRCVFLQLATRSVEILLVKLVVGGVTKTHSDKEHIFKTRITGCRSFLISNVTCKMLIKKKKKVNNWL